MKFRVSYFRQPGQCLIHVTLNGKHMTFYKPYKLYKLYKCCKRYQHYQILAPHRLTNFRACHVRHNADNV